MHLYCDFRASLAPSGWDLKWLSSAWRCRYVYIHPMNVPLDALQGMLYFLLEKMILRIQQFLRNICITKVNQQRSCVFCYIWSTTKTTGQVFLTTGLIMFRLGFLQGTSCSTCCRLRSASSKTSGVEVGPSMAIYSSTRWDGSLSINFVGSLVTGMFENVNKNGWNKWLRWLANDVPPMVFGIFKHPSCETKTPLVVWHIMWIMWISDKTM